MKRWLIRIAIAVAALFIVLTGLAWFVGTTETGFNWIVSALNAASFKKVKLHIENATGTLVGGFAVGTVRVTADRADVIVGNVGGVADFWHLVSGTISLDRLTVGRLQVIVIPHAPTTDDRPLRFFPRLLRLRVDKLEVRDVDIALPNGTHLLYDRVVAQATLSTDNIDVTGLDAHAEILSGRGSARVIAAKPLALLGDIEWRLTPPHQPEWRGHALLKGDLDHLGYGTDVSTPFRATSRGALTNLTKAWRLAGSVAVFDFDVKAWKPDSTLGPATAALDIGGSREGYFASGRVTPRDLGTGALRVRWRGRYQNRTVFFDELAFGPEGTAGEVMAKGTIALTEGPPRLDFTGNWQKLQWPVRGPATVSSEHGHGTLAGQWPLAINAAVTLHVRDLPDAELTALGEIASGQITITDMRGTWLKGSVSAQGEVRYGLENPGWNVKALGTRLNPAIWLKGWPGALDFSLTAAADGLKPDSNWQVDVATVRGRLRGQNLVASGALRRLDQGFGFDRVALDLGSTSIRLDGSVTEEIALRWTIKSPDLAKTIPGTAGQLNSSGSLKGKPGVFAVKGHLDAIELKYSGFSVKAIVADVDVDLANRAPSHATIAAENIAWSDYALDSLQLVLSGTTDSHDWIVSGKAADMSSELGGHGSYASELWTAGLERWTLDAPEGPHMKLAGPATLTIGASRLGLTTACLAAEAERFCAEGALDPQGLWNVKASAVRLPLKFLGRGLPGRPEFDGFLALQLDAARKPGALWTGAARIDLSDAAFHYRLLRGQPAALTLGEAHAEINALPENFTSTVKIRATEATYLDANVGLTRQAGRAFADQTLSGTLRAEVHELGLIPLFVTAVDRVDGKLTTAFTLGGTPRAPDFDGTLNLDAKAIDLYQINLQLRDTALMARLKGNTLTFDAKTHAGDGDATMKGELAWTAGQPKGELTLAGKNLRLVNVPEVRIVASPDLKMHVEGRRIDVSGEVTVPYARIAPVKLTGAVLASSDEIIVGAQATPPEKQFAVYSRLRLVLGQDVRIETYGLTGKLSGSVTSTSGPEDTGTGVGELKVEDGKYTVLARRLDIERGRLLFNGGPLSNPGIDIRAVKRLPDIVAGANVRGTLREPRLSFFSDPPISQSQIVSLLIAGGTLESLQNNSSQQVGSSRNQILAQGGAILASELGGHLPIEDITVESNQQNETSLVLGRYLSPRLYVSYGVSLTESINTLKLQYTLGDRWTLKTESGEARSADIVYTIER